MRLLRIVSGGQTGADRAALDAALAAGFECGGWCPEGRLAADGFIPLEYPLIELAGGGYRQRTIKNIMDSDGTAIFYFGGPSGGTELTLAKCIQLHKPYQLIDAREVSAVRASQILLAFSAQYSLQSLNVAGPRETSAPGVYSFVREAVSALVQMSRAGW